MLKRNWKFLLPFVLSPLLVACDNPFADDDNNDNNTVEQYSFNDIVNNIKTESCSAEEANNELYEYMSKAYFWPDELTDSFNPKAYQDLSSALDSLRVDEDRFSFVITEEQYQSNYVTSTYFGYGFSSFTNSTGDGWVVRFVFDSGSAAQEGLRRGDVITSIDGQSMSSIVAGLSAQTITLEDVLGPNQDGYAIDIVYEKPTGEQVSATISKSEVTSNTVLATQVKDVELNGEDTKVGYLVFNSFRTISKGELQQSFATFKDEGAEELILDLRYNGGGTISTAQQLATQIGGDNVEEEIFAQYVHNKHLNDENSTILFDLANDIQQLNLDRVTVLTTENSCSASELVINSLSPFIEVNVVGDNTCGKPIGMYAVPMCEHRVFAINFQVQSALGDGSADYFDGLPADCFVDDAVVGDWGSENDPLLAEGIHYLQTGNCSAVSQQSAVKMKKQRKVDYEQIRRRFNREDLL